MGNIIYEKDNILVVTEDTNIINETENEIEDTEETTLSGYEKNEQYLSENPVMNFLFDSTDSAGSFVPSMPVTIIGCTFDIILFIVIGVAIHKHRKAKKAQKAAFEQKYAEKNAYDHYSSGSSSSGNSWYYDFDDNDPDFRAFIRKMIDEQGHSGTTAYFRNLYAYYRATTGKTTYDGTYTRNDDNSYNNYNNQSNNYNNTASSSQPTNPFADKFEGKTPDEARKIYLKYMKAFHSDTGDGSDDEDVKLINAAYDEYKKKHGI
jgi:hypothetical protein